MEWLAEQFQRIITAIYNSFVDFFVLIIGTILGWIAAAFFWVFKWVVIVVVYIGVWISDLIAQVFFQAFTTVISFTPLQQIIDSQIMNFDPFIAYLLNAIGFYQFLNIVMAAFIYTYGYQLLRAGIQFWKFWK